MPRYIDADALIDFLDVGHLRHPSELCFSEIDVANLLLHAPTISPDEVRGVGKWIIRKTAFGKEYTVCSACLTEIKIRKTSGEIVHADMRNARYCMACGVKMEVSE